MDELNFPNAWLSAIKKCDLEHQLTACWQAVQEERARGFTVYPSNDQIFAALERTTPAQVRVVILGQDPYHQPGQAHGYAFSVPQGVKPPPSLKNIYKGLTNDIPGFKVPEHGCLEYWARQGVLLLNTVWTVREGQAGSHQQLGWQHITKAILETIIAGPPVVFILWGKHAQEVLKGIDTSRHHVLTGVHPSPLSAYRGFYDQGHFRLANEALASMGYKNIDWHLPN